MPVSIIILAAGSSSRMGQSKQLLPWGKETLLSHAINTALASVADRVFVVLGNNEEAHRRSIENLPVVIVTNPSWEKGMGSSIKAGLTAAKDSDAVLIMVCDQPFVTAQHLDNIINQHIKGRHQIVASKYPDTIGVPALFSKDIFNELMNIGNVEGAKKVFLEHDPALVVLKTVKDLDTPEDYENALPD